MSQAENAEIMRRYLAAWERNDWEATMACWSDDIVHHVPGRGRLAGDFHGKQAFQEHYGTVSADLGGTIEVARAHDVLVNDDHAVTLVVERAIRGERSREFNRVVVYHIRDGLITETWSHDYDSYALDEFWA